MRKELALRNKPWVWVLFTFFMIFYLNGFIYKAKNWNNHIFLSLFISIGFTYFMACWETIDGIKLKKLSSLNKKRVSGEISFEIPRSWVGVLVAWPLELGVFAFLLLGPTKNYTTIFNLAFVAMGFLLFMLRDMALIQYCQLSNKPQGAKKTAFLYLIILYVLPPFLLLKLGSNEFIFLFLPHYFLGLKTESFKLAMILPPLIQFLIIGALAHA